MDSAPAEGPGGEDGKHHHREFDDERRCDAFRRTIDGNADKTAEKGETVKRRRPEQPVRTAAEKCQSARERAGKKERTDIGAKRIEPMGESAPRPSPSPVSAGDRIIITPIASEKSPTSTAAIRAIQIIFVSPLLIPTPDENGRCPS